MQNPTHTMQVRHEIRGAATRARWIITLALGMMPLFQAAADEDAQGRFVPLPQDIFGESGSGNPVSDLTHRMVDFSGQAFRLEMPDALRIDNEGGTVTFNPETRTLTYGSGRNPLHLVTDRGLDVTAPTIRADMAAKRAYIEGPMIVYQDESVTRAESGIYDWNTETLEAKGVRTKVNGILVRGSSVSYGNDAQGKRFLTIRDAYVSTDDIKEPGSWLGAGELTVYPGDYGRLTRLSVATSSYDIPIPILGWFTLSHSLNPREGYMPGIGTKSMWGAYLENSYGFLIGNRRVEGGIPVSDYILTLHADYRTRRGIGTGLDFEDVEMRKKYGEMYGLQSYYAQDEDPMINPTGKERQKTRHNRYRFSLRSRWELDSTLPGDWALTANVNAVSDRYMLRDFFENESRLDDKPDNTVTLTRRTARSQAMLYTRFSPNNYYQTDERLEASFYGVRTAIGKTGINYETRNSASVMRQYIPAHQRLEYRQALDELRNEELREYYGRLLNSSGYARVNTTHEVTTSFKVLRFLNVTPKGGVGYTGYYDVDGIGSDNRFLGYASCDFDIKFNRHWQGFSAPSLDLRGLTHVLHPYATISHGNISSSNALVPKVDTWSSTLGGSTVDPMPLDLIGLTGIDSWSTWTIWRMGARNVLTSDRDGERVQLLSMNTFIDYNVENPNTERRFSNLYSIIRFTPARDFALTLETQTPTIRDGDGFSQYNTSISYQPTAWLEGTLGHRYINNHPIQADSSQLYLQTNIRINENYTFAGRWHWEIEEKRLPIQQYSIFRNTGAWFIGATLFLRDNGGKKETGFGISFTLGETGTALPINFF